MRKFNYSLIKEKKWDSELLGLIAAIYKEAGKQEMYLKQRPEELENLWRLQNPEYRSIERHRRNCHDKHTYQATCFRKDSHLRTGMNRKLQVIGMYWE